MYDSNEREGVVENLASFKNQDFSLWPRVPQWASGERPATQTAQHRQAEGLSLAHRRSVAELARARAR